MGQMQNQQNLMNSNAINSQINAQIQAQYSRMKNIQGPYGNEMTAGLGQHQQPGQPQLNNPAQMNEILHSLQNLNMMQHQFQHHIGNIQQQQRSPMEIPLKQQ